MNTKQKKTKLSIVDTANAEHYQWGLDCVGWHYLKSNNLSIVKEIIPSHAGEKLHFHKESQQFYYIISGIATFHIDGVTYTLEKNQGIHIAPGTLHFITNKDVSELEFLVATEPKLQDDRIQIDLYYPRK